MAPQAQTLTANRLCIEYPFGMQEFYKIPQEHDVVSAQNIVYNLHDAASYGLGSRP